MAGFLIESEMKFTFRVVVLLFALLVIRCGDETSTEECYLPSNPNPLFTFAFTDLASIEHIEPLGEVQPGQVYSDHVYISIKPSVDKVPIYAPTDMELVNVIKDPIDYAMHFKISQEVEYILGHITEPIPEIKQLAQSQYLDLFFCSDESIMSVTAGQLLGYTSGTINGVFDLGVYNSTRFMNFIRPERYESIKIYTHATCPFDYYTSALKTQMYDKFGPMPVTQPLSCRDSRDKAGTIAGAWFDTEAIQSLENVVNSISPLLIATALDGHVKIGRGNEPVYRIFPTQPTYKDPEEITSAHCYAIESSGYFYFQLQPNGNLNVFYSATGTCPDSFPESGFTTYYK